MKKYVAYLILAFAVMFLLPSCENETGIDSAENTLTLTLSCNNLGLTRATIGGEDVENLVKSIDCYFYAAGADKETAALLVRHNVSVRPGNAVGTYIANISFEEAELTTLFETVDRNSSATCLIYVIANRPSVLSLPMNGENTTINKLKALTIASDFINDEGAFNTQESFVMDSDGTPNSSNDTSEPGQNNTNIENDDIVTLYVDNTGSKTLSGIVPLYRTAAKVTLNITRFGPKIEGVDNCEGVVKEDGIVYMPDYSGIYAVFHNGLSTSHIAPDVVKNNFTESESFTTSRFSMQRYAYKDDNGNDKVKYLHENPFYSYSYDWKTSGSKEAYITLVVPWGVQNAEGTIDEETIKEYYYKVPVNYEGDELLRNTHYKINIAVSILGTLNSTDTVTIEPTYTILDWGESIDINSSMTGFRYLMVDKNHYKMDNINEIKIPYWTSHNCTIVNISVKRPNLATGGENLWDSSSELTTLTNEKEYSLSLIKEGSESYIKYHLKLNNDIFNEDFDFAPYTVKFTIQHTDSTTFNDTITIVQYPAIYGEHDYNTDAENDNLVNGNQGFVWVNGYQGSSNEGSVPNRYSKSSFQTNPEHYRGFFEAASGNTLSSSGISSVSMLVFTISSVNGTKYVIGDPRGETVDSIVYAEHTVNGKKYSIWDYAPGVEGAGSRRLENYYATDTNDGRLKNASSNNATTEEFYDNDDEAAQYERTYNMIAPKFRISSGYGMIQRTGEARYYHLMKKRCASYQEDGYPAGRWRLPTKAEFEFIIYLSSQGKIPSLFFDNWLYWCAHGYGVPRGSSVDMTYKTDYGADVGGSYNNSVSISVRCVYDDWYWGSDPVIENKVTSPNDYFIWGDINRANKADAPAINY